MHKNHVSLYAIPHRTSQSHGDNTDDVVLIMRKSLHT